MSDENTGTESEPKPRVTAQSIAAKLAAKQSADEAATETATEPEAKTEPETPVKSRADTVRERLQERAKNRQQREATRAEQSEIARLKSELERHRGNAGADAWLEKFRKDPVKALYEANADPRQMLDLLTKDAIAPGSVRSGAESNEEARAAREEAKRVRDEFQHYVSNQAIETERRAFAEHVGSNKDRYPILSKLKPERRIYLGVRKWNELLAEGLEPEAYDRDLVADAIEAEFEEDQKFLKDEEAKNKPKSEPAAPATLSSSTREEPKQVASKKTKTVTAEMASSSGSARPKTPEQRKAAIVEKLRRQALTASSDR